MIYAAVAGLSASSLAFEILITRYFSIAQWSNLAFLAVGVAMFGFAAGGTFHCMAEAALEKAARRTHGSKDSAARGAARRTHDSKDCAARGAARRLASGQFCLLCVAGALAAIGAFLLVKAVPLDYMKLPVEGAQAAYLLAVWLILSIPFFISGLASCAAYALRPDRSGAVACASLLGGMAGVAAPVFLVPMVGEGGAVAAASIIPLLPVIAAPGTRAWRISALLAAAALAAAAAWPVVSPDKGPLSVVPSPYKTLPQLLQASGTRVTRTTFDIRGRLEEVESPVLHDVPGLSLGFTGDFPRQKALIRDGDSTTTLYDLSSRGLEEFARWTHPYAAHVLAEAPESCLVIQQGGGLALVCALAGGAARVTCAADDPRIADRVARHYRSAAGAAAGTARSAAEPAPRFRGAVRAAREPPRAFLARASERFDVISVEAWGPVLPGMASLDEDGLLTRESVRACWRRLTDTGVLAVSRRIAPPPSDSLRVFSTCRESLAREGVSDPERHLAVIRSWDSCTVLACRAALEGALLSRLESFARARGFDLDWFPGITARVAGRFNVYAAPVFTEAYRSIIGDAGFTARYPLDIRPQGDDRPFPYHFIRWTRVKEFMAATGNRAYALFLSGDVVAAATLLAALAAGLALIVPAILAGRSAARPRASAPSHQEGRIRFLLIAAASGLGFILVEMAVIDAISMAFPAPAVGLTLALGGILASSAFGGLASGRIHRRSLGVVLAAAAAGVAAAAFLVPLGVRAALSLGGAARAAACLLLSAVPGFLIGIPFPAAMRTRGEASRSRAAAWAVNGCASSAGSILSALIAPAAGIRLLFLLAAGVYALAAAFFSGRGDQSGINTPAAAPYSMPDNSLNSPSNEKKS